MKYLSQLKPDQLKGKTCLVRVDLNVEDEKKDNFRLQAILPTLKFLIKNKAKIIILSHRGRRPKLLSLKPFAKIISRLLKKPVRFLENLRFSAGEEKNDKKFAKRLAALGDIYINDAFAVSHRQNASVVAITKFLPSYAGLLLEKEIKNLGSAMKNFRKPLIVVLGGVKVSDKIGLIKYFFKKADYFLIGGAMANTFFAAFDLPIGDSVFEKKMIFSAKKLLKSSKIILPVDAKIENRKILDIGPETIKKYGEIIKKAKTIIWNGPIGYFENSKFARGTEEIVKIILKNKKAKIVIGGGETTSLLKLKNLKLKNNTFVSTGGGAMLEYLAGKKLPGLEALKK